MPHASCAVAVTGGIVPTVVVAARCDAVVGRDELHAAVTSSTATTVRTRHDGPEDLRPDLVMAVSHPLHCFSGSCTAFLSAARLTGPYVSAAAIHRHHHVAGRRRGLHGRERVVDDQVGLRDRVDPRGGVRVRFRAAAVGRDRGVQRRRHRRRVRRDESRAHDRSRSSSSCTRHSGCSGITTRAVRRVEGARSTRTAGSTARRSGSDARC